MLIVKPQFFLSSSSRPVLLMVSAKLISSISLNRITKLYLITANNTYLVYLLPTVWVRYWQLKNLQSNLKLLSKSPVNKKYAYFAKYYFVGLGYKMYVVRNTLLIWVGLTHYTLIRLPYTVRIFAKKRRIYILGSSRDIFKNFLLNIRRAKKKDIYKGKGLLEVKTYKNFIRMKTGKKKQY